MEMTPFSTRDSKGLARDTPFFCLRFRNRAASWHRESSMEVSLPLGPNVDQSEQETGFHDYLGTWHFSFNFFLNGQRKASL